MERILDKEWVCLIIQAKQMGIPIEDVRAFIRKGSSLVDISHIENKNEVCFTSTLDPLMH